jgi:hypothetical protein
MKHRMTWTMVGALLAWAFCAGKGLADSVFSIDDPPVDFEVIDADPFDGFGDNGPFPTFNDAVLGTLGEARSSAEFDLSPFSIPPGEEIVSATFEVRVTSVHVQGLGVNGEVPGDFRVDGYIGDGIAELSDFRAGNGNVLDSVATPDPFVGQILSFDVTSFLADLVAAHETFAGLTLRAGGFGGMMFEEGSGYPRLTIVTSNPAALGQDDPAAGSLSMRNVPNPFIALTRIEYGVSAGSGPAVLTIHDAAGRLVRTMLDASDHPGIHSLLWDGTDQGGTAVSPGVYFCRLEWNGRGETRRMLRVR